MLGVTLILLKVIKIGSDCLMCLVTIEVLKRLVDKAIVIDINDPAQLCIIIQNIMTSTLLSLVSKYYNDLNTVPEQSLTTTPTPIRFLEKEIRFK